MLQPSGDHKGGRTRGYKASGLSQTSAPFHPTMQPPRPTGDLLLLSCPRSSELGRRVAPGSPSACALYTQCPWFVHMCVLVPSRNFCPQTAAAQKEKSEKIMKDWKGEVGVREPPSGGQRPRKRKRFRGGRELRQNQIQAWIHPKPHSPFHLKPPSLGLCCFFNILPSPSLKHRLLLELPEDSFLPCTHTKTPDQHPCSGKPSLSDVAVIGPGMGM